MKKLFLLTSLIILAVSCTKNSGIQIGSFLTGSGVFILNEGNFIGGTGSLSFYSYDSAKIYNDLFLDVNGWPLGSIPNSMKLNDDNAYILVNNSGKIEVVNKNTLESVSTINGLISPRNISIINNTKAYITNLYSDSVAIISLTDNSISGYINIRRYSEAIVINGNKAFVSNMTGPDFVGGNEVMVINTVTDEVVDSIIVGVEPESMVIDKNKMVWVLCNGGYARNNYAELIGINTVTNIIERRFVFPTKLASPNCLQIDGAGETLYYLESGVRRMNIDDSELPSATLITESGHYFYKIGINPVNSDIFVTDAIDYEQPGYILLYNREGNLLSTEIADIVPGMMCFKLNDDFQAE
jgi:YVTN family beta-propeller protein